eukprot:NODE_444_length_7340_cov_0.313631.p4 type:complete len:317 gc:universal NODE_444_length_7340_cov_0.313631:4328-5278(+)
MTKEHSVWVEKYRPHKLDDICGQEHVTSSLKGYLHSKDMPHLLFYGAAGTGKTSTILAFAKQFYEIHNSHYKQHILELNASDERGIQVVRDKIKLFARQQIHGVPYKLIVLDEFDAMTNDAQAALRRIMEDYVSVTRFCLICNYVGKIIDPIKSRCAQFQFKGLEYSQIQAKLRNICNREDFELSDDRITKIVQYSEGDMRKCVYTLQTLKSIKSTEVEDVLGIVPDDSILEILKVLKSESFQTVFETVNDLMMEGYSASNILNQLYDFVVMDMEISEEKKAKLAMIFGEFDTNMLRGNGKIQLCGALAKTHIVLQ